MKKYRSHKVVSAMEIAEIWPVREFGADPGITLVSPDGEKVSLSDEWLWRHQPQVGGYYVVYPDSYSSYSPREAFENGYAETDGKQITSEDVLQTIRHFEALGEGGHAVPGYYQAYASLRVAEALEANGREEPIQL